MSVKRAITALLAALLIAGCAGSEFRSSTGEYIDDTAITAKVKTRLLRSKDTSGTAINVETFKGTVQLSGFVDSAEEKRRAGEIAAEVEGVSRVQNRLTVKGT